MTGQVSDCDAPSIRRAALMHRTAIGAPGVVVAIVGPVFRRAPVVMRLRIAVIHARRVMPVTRCMVAVTRRVVTVTVMVTVVATITVVADLLQLSPCHCSRQYRDCWYAGGCRISLSCEHETSEPEGEYRSEHFSSPEKLYQSRPKLAGQLKQNRFAWRAWTIDRYNHVMARLTPVLQWPDDLIA